MKLWCGLSFGNFFSLIYKIHVSLQTLQPIKISDNGKTEHQQHCRTVYNINHHVTVLRGQPNYINVFWHLWTDPLMCYVCSSANKKHGDKCGRTFGYSRDEAVKAGVLVSCDDIGVKNARACGKMITNAYAGGNYGAFKKKMTYQGNWPQ